MNIEHSSVFTKIRTAETRNIVNEGSSRSTKTISICQYLIMKCMEERIKVTGARAKLTWAKATMIPDFLWVLDEHFHAFNPNDWNKTESIYYFPNGSEFSFIGLDEPQKLHGRKQDYFWINEAIEATQTDFRQATLRTTKQMILDYNPSMEQHWIYDSVITREDCTFIKSTYKDNPFLETAIIREIESMEPTPENVARGTADEVSWKIYGLGERAAHRGLIFGDWNIAKDLPPKENWTKYWYGLDFGFTNDPTAFGITVLCNNELYHKTLFYKKGLTNIRNAEKPDQDSIQANFEKHNIPKNKTIWADSADPKAIRDLHNCGYDIRATEKGPDSIIAGIETLKRYKNNITEDSMDLIKERNMYKWKEDKQGRALNEPIDLWNHEMDRIRYGAFMEVRRNNNHKVFSPSKVESTMPAFQQRDRRVKYERYFG